MECYPSIYGLYGNAGNVISDSQGNPSNEAFVEAT